MTQPLELYPEDAERDAATQVDEALDSLITLVDAMVSRETGRVLPRHLLGAFNELVEQGRIGAVTEEVDPPAAALDLFNALDELVDLGYLSVTIEGYALTDLGKERASITANAEMDDVAQAWRI